MGARSGRGFFCGASNFTSAVGMGPPFPSSMTSPRLLGCLGTGWVGSAGWVDISVSLRLRDRLPHTTEYSKYLEHAIVSARPIALVLLWLLLFTAHTQTIAPGTNNHAEPERARDRMRENVCEMCHSQHGNPRTQAEVLWK